MASLAVASPVNAGRFRIIPVEQTTIRRFDSSRGTYLRAFKTLYALVIVDGADGGDSEKIYALGPTGESVSLETLVTRLPKIGDLLDR